MDLNFDQPAPYTLSANEIRQFTECPRKRYYASRDCLAIRVNKPSKNLELGKAVHMYLGYMYVELNKLVQERLVNNGSRLNMRKLKNCSMMFPSLLYRK